MVSLILYACPTGPLAEQLTQYFTESARQVGPNAAHQYMPHITLTGFFHDVRETVPAYVALLEQLLCHRPPLTISLERLLLTPEFHGIEIISPDLKALTQEFVELAPDSTRTEALRPKDWLHLSLAYQFPAEKNAQLEDLAHRFVSLEASVSWEVRFYERGPGNHWICHGNWKA